ncbi:putative calcium-binding protein CML45 [Acorus calamus]|uniref:Calcium-binding protein CML45 n=1 Tax=Acorus calamus TaxID=4465 RepID=A0AAV9E6B3_ACOCL|nr:putative calcium-binding protein CML45 [Acorus calamus]
MEKTFSAEAVLGFFLICQIINWVLDFAKLNSSLAALFLFKYELLSVDSKVCVDCEENSSADEGKEELKLKKAEVEAVMERLGMDCDHESETIDGFLGLEDLSSVFEEEEPSLEEVREAFHVFDDDKDGFVGAKDLQRVLVRLGFNEGRKLEACEKMIEAVGGNCDGWIDFNGFVKFMENSFC